MLYYMMIKEPFRSHWMLDRKYKIEVCTGEVNARKGLLILTIYFVYSKELVPVLGRLQPKEQINEMKYYRVGALYSDWWHQISRSDEGPTKRQLSVFSPYFTKHADATHQVSRELVHRDHSSICRSRLVTQTTAVPVGRGWLHTDHSSVCRSRLVTQTTAVSVTRRSNSVQITQEGTGLHTPLRATCQATAFFVIILSSFLSDLPSR